MEGVTGSVLPRRTFTELFILSLTGLIFSVCALSFSSYIFHISKHVNENVKLPFLSGKPIPRKFVIDDSVLSPVLDQGLRGTCWMFQVIGILETQYKQQGLERGYIAQNQYIRLSHEGLAAQMVQKCLKYPDSSVCKYSPRRMNTSQGGSLQEYVNFINEWPEMKKWIVPAACCPYQQLPENEMTCPGLEQCIRDNPLEFELIQSFVTTNIRDMKQRLYETEVPHAFSITNPQQRYIFPCDNIMVSKSASCKNRELRCPHNLSMFCSVHDFKLYKARDTEFIFHKTGMTVPGTGHAMLLVGYNDDFVPKRGVNFSRVEPPKGGFILKNSWAARGHTFEYLMGQITEDQDAVFCPNKDDVLRWVPATFECMKKNNNPKLCSNDALLQRGHALIKNADELICVNDTHCNVNSTYALLRENSHSMAPSIYWSPEGIPFPRVIRYENNKTPVIEIFNTLPIQHLYYALQLKNPEKPIEGKCGYVFMPYEMIYDMKRMVAGQGNGFFTTEGIRVNWTKNSFKASGARLNYTLVDKSMDTFSPTYTNDPLITSQL